MAKLKLEFYPYTYVRILSMKSKLFKKEDYDKLIKMEIGQIVEYLQESGYQKEINQLATTHQKSNLIEAALRKNLVADIEKLRRINTEEMRIVIDMYLKRYDVYNIKTILRALHTNTSIDETKELLMIAGTLPESQLTDLMESSSVEACLKKLGLFDKKGLNNALLDIEKTKSLHHIENKLDKEYYERLFQFLGDIPKVGNLFKDFVKFEVDSINIKLLLRLKKAGLKPDEIKAHMLSEHRFDDKLFTQSFENVVAYLAETRYGDIIKKHRKELHEGHSLTNLEVDLDRFLLRRGSLLIHQNPLSIDVILGFLFAKDIEVKNVQAIAKGKQLGVDEDFLQGQVII